MDGLNSIDCFDLSRYEFVYGEFIPNRLHIDKFNLFIRTEKQLRNLKKAERIQDFHKKPFATVNYFGEILVHFISLFCLFGTASFSVPHVIQCAVYIFLNKPMSVQRSIQIISTELLRDKNKKKTGTSKNQIKQHTCFCVD